VDIWDFKNYYPVSLEGKRIDIIYLYLPHPVSMNWRQGMIDQNEQWGMELNDFDSNFNSEVISDLVDASIARKVDLIIFSPMDPASGSPPVERAQAAGIPILSFLNISYTLPDIAIYPDSYQQGNDIGHYLANALGNKGEVAVFVGDLVSAVGQARRQGFMDAIAQYPDMEIVANTDAPTGPWTRQGAYDTTKGILAANPDIDGIFAGDDEMAVGSYLAIEEANKVGEIVLVGLGGEKSGLEAVKEGRLAATSYYSPYQMGKDLIDAAVYILSSPGYKAGSLQGIKWTDIPIVDINNVDDVLWPPVG